MTIIAELGNHGGSLERALEMIDAAAGAGCGLVRFQKRTGGPAELGPDDYRAIDARCRERGIGWFASAWDVEAQQFLRPFDCDYNAVACPMLHNIDLMNEIAAEGKHTFIGTGQASWVDIDIALAIFSGVPYTLMHTVEGEPMPEEAANLRTMEVMRERYSCPVGYIGREAGTFVSTLAFVLGADAIERRLTLERAGPDQADALTPDEMKRLVDDLHRAQRIMGDGGRMRY